ncbi:MAG: hypothetical protein M0R03_10505 [Novosphingobium sp.]|nr:hypothetical protein [Novosphingobium sp.]
MTLAGSSIGAWLALEIATKALPQGELRLIPEAGYYASFDQPAVFADAIIDFARRSVAA